MDRNMMRKEINEGLKSFKTLMNAYKEYKQYNHIELFFAEYNELIRMQDYIADKWDLQSFRDTIKECW